MTAVTAVIALGSRRELGAELLLEPGEGRIGCHRPALFHRAQRNLEHLGDDDGGAAVVFRPALAARPRLRSPSSSERQQLVVAAAQQAAAQQAAACRSRPNKLPEREAPAPGRTPHATSHREYRSARRARHIGGRRQVSAGVVDLGAAGAGSLDLVALARACGGTAAAAGNELGDRGGAAAGRQTRSRARRSRRRHGRGASCGRWGRPGGATVRRALGDRCGRAAGRAVELGRSPRRRGRVRDRGGDAAGAARPGGER